VCLNPAGARRGEGVRAERSLPQALGVRALSALGLVSALVLSSGCAVTLTKRNLFHFQHSVAVSDPAFRRSLDGFGTVMVGGNRVDILDNGDAIFPAMLGAIREAKQTVSLESYIYQDDEVGKAFAAALEQAAQRGVEVRLLLDGTGGRAGKLAAEMTAGGVKVRIFHPIRPWTLYKIGERTHRKLLVVDGRVGFTGGVGIEARWLGNARNPKEWRDTQVRITGPVTAQLQAIFGEDWTYTTGEILAGEKFYPALGPTGSLEAQAIKVSHGDASSLAKMLYYISIESAEHSFHMQNAYFLPDKQVRQALIDAVKRGVDVKVMVPGKRIDVPPVRSASWVHYGELLQGGVKIYEYVDTMLHTKNATADGIFSTVGSINFDARSFEKNAEANVVIYDRGFAQELENDFAADLKHCREITYEHWQRRGLKARLFEVLSWFFQPLY
jgi:cardiolipin synthase